MNSIPLSEHVSVGDAPASDADVQRLADASFQSIFNVGLNAAERDYSSRREGICARESGLIYLSHPIRDENWDSHLVDSFRTKLELLPAPTYVHGHALPKAAAICLVDHALREDWSTSDALQFASDQKLPCCDTRWADLIARAIDTP